METGILYVVFNKWINDPKTNEMPYKIGITKNSVDERYYGLGLKMPGEFETLFAYKIKDYSEAEKSIQRIFREFCVNGEWFKLSQKELDLLKTNCETMGGILVTDEIDSEIIIETEAENINISSNYENKLEDLIKTIGMKTFVQYYDKFKNNSVQEIIQYMKLHEKYTINSIRTKTATGKRIFKNNLERKALEIISKARNVEEMIKKEALILLNKE
ncbi:MAG: GIY-YIG nuclease family protein [Spirochaetaceae bacterium]|jgi:hypothetical protein|nr:GIY-YIG nuclease family protein [Spirochaetaceae bacterium]